MPRFAELQSRLNQAAQKHLVDATADFGNGLVVDVQFSAGYVESQGFVAGNQPSILVMESLTPGVKRDSYVNVRGVDYTVGEVQPDGTGMVLLMLEK